MKESNKFDITNHTMTHDNVLIRAISPQKVHSTGLIDPAQYEDKSEWGEVIDVGPGRIEMGNLITPSVKKGDIVLYGKYSSYKVRVGGYDYLIIRDDDIMSYAR
jgi:chaperonin GroES